MPRARIIQTSFTGGELNPVLYGRVDLETYYKGAAKLENVLIMPQGGVKRRSGLAYIDKAINNKTRLIPFNYNDEVDYLLAVSVGTLKIYKNDVLQATLTTGAIANITEDMLNALNYSQTTNKLILVHEDLQPIEVTRSSDTSWSTIFINFTNIPTYKYEENLEDVISTARGWPKSVTFFGGRMVLGGLKSRPQTILMSKVEDIYNLNTTTVNDDDGIDITMSDNQSVAIRNIYPGRNLQVFTSGGEFFVLGGSNDVITPANISLQKSTSHGSGTVTPLSVDGSTLFFEVNGKVLREFTYSDLEQTYAANDISILSAHLLNTPMAMAIRRSTSTDSANYLYVVNADGTMAVLNTLRQQELRAWSHFTTKGCFEEVTVIGSDVYVVVKRTINNVATRQIEKFDDSCYLDSAISSTSASSTTNWSGFDNLIGEAVKVIGDDFILDDVHLVTGSFNSSKSVLNIQAGMDFAFEVQTLPADLTLGNKVMTGEYKRFVATNLRLSNSRDIIVKAGNGSYKPSFQSFGNNILDIYSQKYNGWQKVSLGGYSRAGQITVTQTEPLDFHLMALTIEITI